MVCLADNLSSRLIPVCFIELDFVAANSSRICGHTFEKESDFETSSLILIVRMLFNSFQGKLEVRRELGPAIVCVSNQCSSGIIYHASAPRRKGCGRPSVKRGHPECGHLYRRILRENKFNLFKRDCQEFLPPIKNSVEISFQQEKEINLVLNGLSFPQEISYSCAVGFYSRKLVRGGNPVTFATPLRFG